MRHNLQSDGHFRTKHCGATRPGIKHPGIKQQGFSMLEILITLVIVATALFGTAGMQINAMRMNKGAEFRTQAVLLASDMADRMEANKVAAIAG